MESDIGGRGETERVCERERERERERDMIDGASMEGKVGRKSVGR